MSNPLSPNMDSNYELEVALEMNSDSQIPPPMFNAHWDCSFSMSNHSTYTGSSNHEQIQNVIDELDIVGSSQLNLTGRQTEATNSSNRNPDRMFALIDPDPYEFQIPSIRIIRMNFFTLFQIGDLVQCFEEECGLWRFAYPEKMIDTHKVIK